MSLFDDEDFHTPKTLEVEEIEDEKQLNLFDFLNALTFSKKNLLTTDEAERLYSPYVINMGLMNSMDTILLANEMNRYPNCPKIQHYDFLLNIIRKGKRYDKWAKTTNNPNLDIIKEFYNVSTRVAKQYISLVNNDDIEVIKKKLFKGGRG